MSKVKPMSADDALRSIERLGDLLSALNTLGGVYGLEKIPLEGGFVDRMRAIATGKHIVSEVKAVGNSRKPSDEVWNALEKAVKLNSMYAALLNIYDDGKRIEFVDATEWMQRLKVVKG
jgi:hypothetical protein